MDKTDQCKNKTVSSVCVENKCIKEQNNNEEKQECYTQKLS